MRSSQEMEKAHLNMKPQLHCTCSRARVYKYIIQKFSAFILMKRDYSTGNTFDL